MSACFSRVIGYKTHMDDTLISPGSRRAVAFWLWMVCTLIVLMVAVGGITRLTESGLSIVNWNPIMGAIPPRDTAEWEEAFEMYRATPQFQKFDREHPGGMTLAHFQKIFFWEYIHRLLGRLIGMAYALPFFGFLLFRRVRGRLAVKLWIGLLLGGGQGFLGWFMVKSGLVDRPYVSHFRLAAHLTLALTLFSYLLWIALDLEPFWKRPARRKGFGGALLLGGSWVLLGLLVLQIVYGAFTAGLRAGYMYNSYPLMGGQFLPDTQWNILSDPASVQFVHRHLGLAVFAAMLIYWLLALCIRLPRTQKIGIHLMLGFCGVQFLLGVLTLLTRVHLHTAVAHQVVACLLLGSVIVTVHELTAPKTVTSRRS